MKVEKAIDWLKYAVPIKALTWEEFGNFITAVNMAREVLQKNIPKEPIWEGDGYADGEMVYDTWRCPECDMPYEQDQIHNYCPDCGQKILWYEENNDE